jgi:hypothetical protein
MQKVNAPIRSLQDLWGTLVQSGYDSIAAGQWINGAFGAQFAICDFCNKYGADVYDHDYGSTAICSTCEDNQPAINDLVKMEAEDNL